MEKTTLKELAKCSPYSYKDIKDASDSLGFDAAEMDAVVTVAMRFNHSLRFIAKVLNAAPVPD